MKWNQLLPKQKSKLLHWFFIYSFVGVLFMSLVVTHMIHMRDNTDYQYQLALEDDEDAINVKNKLADNAVEVTSGTYVESVKEISIKNSSFRTAFQVWFRWKGHDDISFIEEDSFRVYNGVINSWEVIKDTVDNGIHYQKLSIDATVTRSFDTARFPLGAHVLKFNIQPKDYTVDKMVFVPDRVHSDVNDNLSISGYDLTDHTVNDYVFSYPNTMSHPTYKLPKAYTELVTVLKVTQDGFGLYLRCFIALIGTTTWALMSLYACSNHYVNPLSTMATTLFGTVSNMMICTNLQPDVVSLGLAEYVNIWGILTILATTMAIIQVNYLRDELHEKTFSKSFGRVLFWTILVLCIVGHLIMPFSAWVR